MSEYTTGELARLCGVTVRTVQYYDRRGILEPTSLSEGGRRLYSENDLRRLKLICFLRELDMPIDSISKLLKEEHPEKPLSLLLERQEESLRQEISEKKDKLDKLTELQRSLRRFDDPDHEDIGDAALLTENKKSLSRIRAHILAVGLVADVIEWVTVLLWIFTGIWWPFAVGMPIVIGISVWISRYYFVSMKYICPECHAVFRPSFKESFWAKHTFSTRRLTCPCCNHFGFCVETYGKENEPNA